MDRKVNGQTRQLNELVLVLTSQQVTARPFPVSFFAWFCTPPEVKFQVFSQLKPEEKSILNYFFFRFLIRTSCRFDQANKKSVIYTLNRTFYTRRPIIKRVKIFFRFVLQSSLKEEEFAIKHLSKTLTG